MFTSHRTLKALLAVTTVLAATQPAAAAPQGGQVTAGTATISSQTVHTGGATAIATTVHQSTQKAVITWNGFDLNTNDSVNFSQPNANAITLNEISGPASKINGTITGNGQLWFINPNGFLFNGAGVSAGSLLFSTSQIEDGPVTGSGFYTNNSGYYRFAKAQSDTPGTISLNNTSMYSGTPGGYYVLQGQNVQVNNSRVTLGFMGPPNSKNYAAMAVGNGFSADFDGDGLISYAVNAAVSQKVAGQLSSLALNNSNVQTSGGGIMFTAVLDKDAVLDHVINLGGDYYDGNGNVSNPAVGNNLVNGKKALYAWHD